MTTDVEYHAIPSGSRNRMRRDHQAGRLSVNQLIVQWDVSRATILRCLFPDTEATTTTITQEGSTMDIEVLRFTDIQTDEDREAVYWHIHGDNGAPPDRIEETQDNYSGPFADNGDDFSNAADPEPTSVIDDVEIGAAAAEIAAELSIEKAMNNPLLDSMSPAVRETYRYLITPRKRNVHVSAMVDYFKVSGSSSIANRVNPLLIAGLVERVRLGFYRAI